MTGDSVVPLIANFYAFGAKDFDVKTALHFMLDAATEGGVGRDGYVERPEIDTYLRRGYLPLPTTSCQGSFPAASISLEWSVDDFAISQFADALGDPRPRPAVMFVAGIETRSGVSRDIRLRPARRAECAAQPGDQRHLQRSTCLTRGSTSRRSTPCGSCGPPRARRCSCRVGAPVQESLDDKRLGHTAGCARRSRKARARIAPTSAILSSK
jgi:hypothetical protein